MYRDLEQHTFNFAMPFKKKSKSGNYGAIRRIIIKATSETVVVSFIHFGVCVGIGIQFISILTAFLVFVSATGLLAVSPVRREG